MSEELEFDWSSLPPVTPRENKKPVSIRIDSDVLDFFKRRGKGYQTHMNAVLRTYMEAKS